MSKRVLWFNEFNVNQYNDVCIREYLEEKIFYKFEILKYYYGMIFFVYKQLVRLVDCDIVRGKLVFFFLWVDYIKDGEKYNFRKIFCLNFFCLQFLLVCFLCFYFRNVRNLVVCVYRRKKSCN